MAQPPNTWLNASEAATPSSRPSRASTAGLACTSTGCGAYNWSSHTAARLALGTGRGPGAPEVSTRRRAVGPSSHTRRRSSSRIPEAGSSRSRAERSASSSGRGSPHSPSPDPAAPSARAAASARVRQRLEEGEARHEDDLSLNIDCKRSLSVGGRGISPPWYGARGVRLLCQHVPGEGSSPEPSRKCGGGIDRAKKSSACIGSPRAQP
mmetsp:Transcript_28910/g.66377  ORF Transcript_28910/g.66377 Transcript_28910/m.66377 type:complete len:209 (-) Transcript_28910:59-685(-)